MSKRIGVNVPEEAVVFAIECFDEKGEFLSKTVGILTPEETEEIEEKETDE